MVKLNFEKMSYKDIENRYIELNIKKFRLRNAEDVKKVYNWDFRTCRGFSSLLDDDKILAEQLICMFLNNWGLETRHLKRPVSIKQERTKFKINTKNDGYHYLGFDGSIS